LKPQRDVFVPFDNFQGEFETKTVLKVSLEPNEEHIVLATCKQRVPKMAYEHGMQLIFDLVDRTVVVSFRNDVRMLGPFADQKAAIRAGEQYCRDHGWDDSQPLRQPAPVAV
jgi:hypothetical protein